MIIQHLDGRLEHVPAHARQRQQAFLQAFQHAVATYQYWNALYLNPRQYG